MNSIRASRVERLICELVALRTVNPMGKPYEGTSPVERPVVEYLEQLFAPYDVELRRLSCDPIYESLLISIPGQINTRGTLLESHMDTVPADDWVERAFAPRVVDGYVIGRGACDDKGSLAAMVLAVLELLESGARPPQPVWLLAAGDEEHSQSGIRDFLETEHLPIGRAVFGEPTELQPVVQHKATIRWDITAHGRASHTSRAELGHSAVLDIVQVIESLVSYERDLKRMRFGSLTSGPSLTVTMIEGGRARNIVPDTCKIAVDFRVPPEMDARRGFADLFQQLDDLGLSLTHGEFQCFAPALRTDPNHDFVKAVVEFCRNELRWDVEPTGVPYGSDAGWMPKSVPTIVLGPGSIAQAHAADEHVEIKQLTQAVAIYHRIVSCDWNCKPTY